MADTAIGRLIVDLRANFANFSDDFEKAGKIFERSAKKMEAVGKRMSIAITAPLAAIGTAALYAGQQIDDAMDTIRIRTGKTGDALGQLQNDFKALASSVPSSFQDTSAAIAALNSRLGLTGQPLQELSQQFLDLSRMMGSDLNETLNLGTRAFGDWSIATDKQSQSLDYLFKVSQRTGSNVNQLLTTIVQYGAPLRGLGFSFEQSAAMIGKWMKEGVNVETVLAGMRKAYIKFTQAGVDAGAAFKSLIERMQSAKTATEAMGMAAGVAGAKTFADFGRAVLEGRFKVDDLIESLQRSDETIQEAAKKTDGFAEKLVLFKNKLVLALEPLGTKLLDSLDRSIPIAERFVEWLTKIADSFTKLSPEVQDLTLQMFALTAAIGPAIYAIGSVATAVGALWKALAAVNFGTFLANLTAVSAAGTAVAGAAGGLGVLLSTLLAIPLAAYAFGEAVKKVWNYFSDKADIAAANKSIQGMFVVDDETRKKALEMIDIRKRLMSNIGPEPTASEWVKINEVIKKNIEAKEKSNLTLKDEIKLLEESTNKKLGYVEGLSEEAQWLKIINAAYDAYADNIETASQAISGAEKKSNRIFESPFGGMLMGDVWTSESIRNGLELPDQKTFDTDDALKNMGITPGVMKLAKEKIRTLQDVITEGWQNVAENMEQAFSYGFSDIISGAASLRDSLKNIWTSIKRSFCDMIGQMVTFYLGNFVKRLLGGSAGLLGTFGVSMGSAGVGGAAGAATGTGAGGIGGGILSSLAGGLPLLGGGLGLSLGSTFGGGLFGGGTAGSIMGGIGGGLLGGITGISALGAAATGTGLGGMLSSMGFLFTNPITAILGGGLALGALANYLYKSPADRAAQETGRDFGGIKVSTKTFEEFASGLGLNKSGYEGIRKDLLSSPKYLTEIAYPLAQQQGKVEEFLSKLSSVKTAWGEFDFRTPFETWMKTGSASALNSAFEKAFAQSQALELNLPNWEDALDATAGSSSSSGGRVKIRRPTSVGSVSTPTSVSGSSRDTVNITINLNALDGESAAQATRTKIIPEIVNALKTNVYNSRVNIVSALGV